MNKICVVCFANYCRSPVAEQILIKKYKSEYQVISAGIKPIIAADMDIRSRDYLNSKGYEIKSHLPRRINSEIMNECKYIFALDAFVLQMLNNNYKKFQSKIRLLNFQNPKIRLNDPYTSNDKEYKNIMDNITKVCESLVI